MQVIAHNNFNFGDGLCSISHNGLWRQLQTGKWRDLPESVTHMKRLPPDISKIAFAGEKKEKEK